MLTGYDDHIIFPGIKYMVQAFNACMITYENVYLAFLLDNDIVSNV